MRKLLSISLATLLVASCCFAAERDAENELKFNTTPNVRVDENTKNDIWRDATDVTQSSFNVITKDLRGQVIKVYNNIEIGEGDKLPDYLYDDATKAVGENVKAFKYGANTYYRDTVFVDSDMWLRIQNGTTVILTAFSRFEIVANNVVLEPDICELTTEILNYFPPYIDSYCKYKLKLSLKEPLDGKELHVQFLLESEDACCKRYQYNRMCDNGVWCPSHPFSVFSATEYPTINGKTYSEYKLTGYVNNTIKKQEFELVVTDKDYFNIDIGWSSVNKPLKNFKIVSAWLE